MPREDINATPSHGEDVISGDMFQSVTGTVYQVLVDQEGTVSWVCLSLGGAVLRTNQLSGKMPKDGDIERTFFGKTSYAYFGNITVVIDALKKFNTNKDK